MTVRGPLYGITNQAAGYTLPVPVSSGVQLKVVQVWAAGCDVTVDGRKDQVYIAIPEISKRS